MSTVNKPRTQVITRWIAITCSILVVCVVMAIWVLPGSGAPLTLIIAKNDGAIPGVETRPGSTIAPSKIEREAVADSAISTIVVVDSLGRPVSGAAVLLRAHAESPITPLAKSGADGGVIVGMDAAIQISSGVACISAFGFLPEVLSVNHVPFHQRVSLREGKKLAVRVRDEEGKPVAGAQVEVSPGPMQEERVDLGAFPGADAVRIRQSALTDASGNADIGGLPEGRCRVRVHKWGYVWPKLQRLMVAGDSADITLERAYAVVANAGSDVIEQHWARHTFAGRGWGWTGLRSEVARRFDAEVIMVGRKPASTKLEATLLLRDRGLVDASLEVMELEAITAPQRVDVGGEPRQGEYGRLRVELRNSRDETVVVPPSLIELRMMESEAGLKVWGRPLESIAARHRVALLQESEYTTLPIGEYQVSSMLPMLRSAIGKVVTRVGAGVDSVLVIPLKTDIMRVHIKAVDEWGVEETGGALTVTLADGTRSNTLYGHEWPGLQFVPPGRVRIGITPSGGYPVDVEHVFERNDETLRVTYRRKK